MPDPPSSGKAGKGLPFADSRSFAAGAQFAYGKEDLLLSGRGVLAHGDPRPRGW